MQRNLNGILFFTVFSLFSLLGCNKEKVGYGLPSVNTSIDTIFINEQGGKEIFAIEANRPWNIEIIKNDDVNWLYTDPGSGTDNGKIFVVAFPNQGLERRATLKVQTSTTHAYIVVVQDGALLQTKLFSEDVGIVQVGDNTAVDKFTDWSRKGIGANGVEYFGTDASVRISDSSAGKYTDATGGNNIWLPSGDDSFFSVDNISVGGAMSVKLSFGRKYNLHPAQVQGWKNDLLTVILKTDDGDRTIAYRTTSTTDWAQAEASIKLPVNTQTIGLVFIGSEMRIDDIALTTTDKVTIIPAPIVLTDEVATGAVTQTTARLTGSFTYSAPGVIATGIGYRKTGDTNFTEIDAPGEGSPIAVDIDNLTHNTVYEYYAFVLVGTKVYRGEVRGFKTVEIIAPTHKAIKDIRALKMNVEGYPTTKEGSEYLISGNWKISGVVVSDQSALTGANFYEKCVAIQDETSAGSGITVQLANVSGGYATGDEIEVILTGSKLEYKEGALILTPASDMAVTKTGVNKLLSATVISVTQLKSSDYESMYVAITGSQVAYDMLGGRMNDSDNKGSVVIQTQSSGSFIMYTGGRAAFKNNTLPQGNGTMKGVAGVFVNGVSVEYRLLPQVSNDFSALTGERINDPSTIVLDDPYFVGKIMQGKELDGVGIVIPYSGARSTEKYSYTVTVSGVGAGGFSVVANPVTGFFSQGSGEIVIPIIGTPTAYGEAVFKIEGSPPLYTKTCTVQVEPAEKIMYSVGFDEDDGFVATTQYNKVETYSGPPNKSWITYYGTPSKTYAITGGQSMQMRWYTTSTENIGYSYMDFNVENMTRVEFSAKNSLKLGIEVSYSTDNGNTWLGAQEFALNTTAKTYEYVLSGRIDNARIRFKIVVPDPLPNNTANLIIDNVVIFGK